QIGAPREIYTRPVNRFVASFIGETNFLPAMIGPSGARLASGDPIDLAGGSGEGPVTVTVRPEQVRLVPADEAGAIVATVRDWVYFGTDTHIHLLLKDGSEITARLQSNPSGETGLERGAATGLRFASGALQVVGD
ncbi:MAG: TOBE domain-containing protein, partial [Gemmobacter sp.]|nr:TOBE domain-containing protein [Gemmobacter sp.]